MGTTRTTQRGTIDTTVPGQSVNLHNPGGSRTGTSKPEPEAQQAQQAQDAAEASEAADNAAMAEAEDLSTLTKAELLDRIEARGIEGYSSKNNKAELIAALS